MSGGRGGGDVIEGPPDVHIEVKWRERLNVHEAMAQAEVAARPTDIPVIAHRRSRSGWLATLPLDDVLSLLELREAA